MQSRLIRHTVALAAIAQLAPFLAGCGSAGSGDKTSHVTSVAFSPDSRTLAAGSWTEEEVEGSDESRFSEIGGSVSLFDVPTGQMKRRTSTGNPVWAISFSPDAMLLAVGSGDGRVRLRDGQTLRLLRTMPPHARQVQAVAFAPDGKQVASTGTTTGESTAFRLWDAQAGTLLRTFSAGNEFTSGVAFSPDGRSLAGGSSRSNDEGRVRIWDSASGALVRELTGDSPAVNAIAFAPDGQTLATAHWPDGKIRLWDVQTGQVRQSLPHPRVWVIASSLNCDLLASGSLDGSVRLWDLRTGTQLKALSGRGAGVSSIAVSPDGRWVASSQGSAGIRLWDAQTGEPKWSGK